jgi:exosortase E/protease (VPEID-CTERM system)
LATENANHPSGLYRVLLLAILIAEAVGLSFHLDPDLLLKRQNPGAVEWLIASSPVLLRIGVAFTGVLFVALGPRVRKWAHALHGVRHPARWAWLLGHLLAFGVFVRLSDGLLAKSDSSFHPTPGWFVLWSILAIIAVACWLLAFAPAGFWGRLVRRERLAFAVAALAASVAWAFGQLTQAFWRPLAETTFSLTRLFLDSFYPSITSNAEQGILGTAAFQIQISPACSGYEGISLVTVFLAVYLWLFRHRLRFPQALILFPIGITAIYLANVIRLAALLLVGTHYSPQVAVSGFHSQAGWIAFTVITLVLIALAHRMPFFKHRAAGPQISGRPHIATALLVPFFCLLATAMVASAFSAGFNAWYPVQAIVTAAVLVYFRKAYRELDWEWSWHATVVGGIVFAVWLLLAPTAGSAGSQMQAAVTEMPHWAAATWIFFRVAGSVIVVPMAEELAFRAYLLRKLVSRDFEHVPPGRFTWPSFLLSSILFGLLHDSRWLAGTIAGMLFALILYRRRRFGDAVAAHMTANALIALDVLILGDWSLWS